MKRPTPRTEESVKPASETGASAGSGDPGDAAPRRRPVAAVASKPAGGAVKSAPMKTGQAKAPPPKGGTQIRIGTRRPMPTAQSGGKAAPPPAAHLSVVPEPAAPPAVVAPSLPEPAAPKPEPVAEAQAAPPVVAPPVVAAQATPKNRKGRAPAEPFIGPPPPPPKVKTVPQPEPYQIKPLATVGAARIQLRHIILTLAFLLVVVAPASLYATYLYTLAADRYESDVGFGSRTQETSNAFDILGVLGGGGVASTKDMDILHQFISSQELVTRVDAKLDLRKIWSRHPEDWLFSFPTDGPVEDLVDYWSDMVIVNYDSATGLMALRVFAFTPEDAQAIANEIVVESSGIINELSRTAQEDTTRYSRETLAKAEERYRAAQDALAEFRVRNHIVDPQLTLAGASQVVNGLVQQLAEAEINLDMLDGQVSASDPRIGQLNRRIEVIQKRIAEESAKVGTLGNPTDPGYAELIRDYQALQLEMDFSQKSYVAAQGAYDQAANNAQQQTHYLTTYVAPTLAQSTTAPDRPLHIALTILAGLLIWSSGTMVYYALRDRR